jgi:hypothetical protein
MLNPFETAESTIYSTWRPTKAAADRDVRDGARLSARQTRYANQRACLDFLLPAGETAAGGGVVTGQPIRAKSKESGQNLTFAGCSRVMPSESLRDPAGAAS